MRFVRVTMDKCFETNWMRDLVITVAQHSNDLK